MGGRNVSSNKGIFDFSNKEITIPLEEYTALIERNAVLNQIETAVSKDNSEHEAISILRAILQMDTPKKE
ncbi:MAG: hypothetical protein HFH62_11270 [Lachnospiraceae bacterium]|nr:hypothetical protein [Lachnospiraceae bacterium]